MSCARLSDRMPAVARGEAGWTDYERRHLADCDDCAREWRVVSVGLLTSGGLPAELDPDRVAAGVLHRLATEPPRFSRSRKWWYAGGLATAAAAAVMVVSIIRAGDGADPVSPPETAGEWTIPVMGLDSLDEEQLRVVLESMDEPLATPTGPLFPSVMDLNDQELERVLRSMEG